MYGRQLRKEEKEREIDVPQNFKSILSLGCSSFGDSQQLPLVITKAIYDACNG